MPVKARKPGDSGQMWLFYKGKVLIVWGKYLFLWVIAIGIMKNSTNELMKETYIAPSLKIIPTRLETSFLASNLEPIDGGGDPDIDW